MAVGFFWLSWRIVKNGRGIFLVELEDRERGRGIFLVLLWDFSGYFVGFFWLSWRIRVFVILHIPKMEKFSNSS